VGLVPDVDVMQYIEWAQSNPARSVQIEANQNRLKVWVYNYQLGLGMHAVYAGAGLIEEQIPASEIDQILESRKREDEKRQYEVLKRKFEGGNK